MQLQLEHVTKHIGKAVILDDISLELVGGTVYGLSGKNGCGKTMLMRCISGLMKPSSGRIIVDGACLWDDISFPPSLGLLLESPIFLPSFTGFDNLRLLADIQKKVTHDDIRRALEDVGLDPDDKRSFRKYSLGMKQRLGIAAALFENPNLILLDEPINALDSSGVRQIRERILHHKQRGALILVACHDKEELALLSDEIIYMEIGRVIQNPH